MSRILMFVSDERFLPGRCAAIMVKGSQVGIMGILHPQVITNFGLTNACSALEMDLQRIS